MKKLILIVVIQITHYTLFSQNINKDNLNSLVQYCDSTKADEVLISHKGKTIAHWKRNDFSSIQGRDNITECQTPYMGTASMVKSWTGVLIGILLDKGLIKHVDDLVCQYIPEWEIACKNKITIKHLLTMTAGYKRLGGTGVLSQANMNEFVLHLKPDTLPGIRFAYSNESVQALGILIERVSGLKADEAFDKYLLNPMGIDSTNFTKDDFGNVLVYGGCTTTVANAHKMGVMMMNTGKFGDKQIVSEKWTTESTTPGDLAPYYGYLWWIDKNSKYWNYAATGDLGQMTIVYPQLQLVFVRRQSCDLSPASRNMSWMGGDFLNRLISIVEK